jgi:hypothetical protein
MTKGIVDFNCTNDHNIIHDFESCIFNFRPQFLVWKVQHAKSDSA